MLKPQHRHTRGGWFGHGLHQLQWRWHRQPIRRHRSPLFTHLLSPEGPGQSNSWLSKLTMYVKRLLLFLFFIILRSKYNNVISFFLKILFRVPAHCSKDRLWRPTAFDGMWCELIEPAEPLIRVCLLKWHPITLPYGPCSLALFRRSAQRGCAWSPASLSASLLCLKTLLGFAIGPFTLIKAWG